MSFGGGSSSSQQQSSSGTNWPSGFVAGATPTVGAPLTLEQLLAYRPPTTGVFDAATTPDKSVAAYPGATPGAGLFNQVGATNVGIGAAAPTYTPPPAVTAPTITAATGGLGSGNYDQLRQSLFKQTYDPIAAETTRLGGIADRGLLSSAANAGLATSGVGQGLLSRQQSERTQQLQQQAGQAATSATAQTLGLQEQEQQANLAREQQANIANASNVLAGNTATASNYLATLGLDQQSAQNARSAFLQYLGVQESDLARMDQQKLSSLSTALNAWLQQYATLVAAGRTSQSTGSSDSMNFNVGLNPGATTGAPAGPAA